MKNTNVKNEDMTKGESIAMYAIICLSFTGGLLAVLHAL